MSRQYVDMTGERYGRLTCIEPGLSSRSGRYWICKCDCGNDTEVLRGNLIQGNTVSCGCFQYENRKANGQRSLRHGHSVKISPTYTTWEAMRQRCNNPNSDWYHRYGGRGITICDRWNKFENFLADMGERPEGMTIDRIDSDKNYEPDNCKWSTALEQSCNKAKTNSKIDKETAVKIRNDNRILAEIAKEYGVGISTISRIKRNLTHVQI